jgi:hypothetical protein
LHLSVSNTCGGSIAELLFWLVVVRFRRCPCYGADHRERRHGSRQREEMPLLNLCLREHRKAVAFGL